MDAWQNGVGIPHINKERLLKKLIELCEIEGSSGNESCVADYITSFVQKRLSDKLMIHVYPKETIPKGGETSNIFIRIQGRKTGDTILLSAHMDTVPISFNIDRTINLSNGILRTEGKSVLGGDDRAGIAAALEIMELGLKYPGLHAGIEILFTVQEELGCLGSRYIDTTMIYAEYGYNLDGETPPGSIIIKAPRKSKYNYEIYGESSHAALAPDEGQNAIKIAGEIINKLPQGQLDTDTTTNIGSITGGSQTNIVPDYVIIKGELRSFSNDRFDLMCNQFDKICSSTAESWGSRIKLTWEHSYHGYSVDPSSICVGRFIRACENSGIEPVLLTSPGGGDSNNLNNLGIDNVVFGLGMHEIHTSNEYLVLDEFYTAVEILKNLVFL